MQTYQLSSNESRLMPLGCLLLLLLGGFCFLLLIGLPRNDQGELFSVTDGPMPILLACVGLFVFLLTCGRRTTVDPANRTIIVRDLILLVVPIWVRRLAFFDVTGIQYEHRSPRDWSDDDSHQLTIYLKLGKRRVAIMRRSLEDEFAPCLLSAWRLGKTLGLRIQRIASTTQPKKRDALARITFDRYPTSTQFLGLIGFSAATIVLGYLFFSRGDSPDNWALLLLGLLCLGVALSSTYNRRTRVDPNQRRIFIRDRLLRFIPIRTIRIEFNDVVGVEYVLRPPPFYNNEYRMATVTLVTRDKQWAILDRVNDYQLDPLLASARDLAQTLERPFTDVSPESEKKPERTAT